MSSTFIERNNEYASTFDKGSLPMPPSKNLLVGTLDMDTQRANLELSTKYHFLVTCMDARIK